MRDDGESQSKHAVQKLDGHAAKPAEVQRLQRAEDPLPRPALFRRRVGEQLTVAAELIRRRERDPSRRAHTHLHDLARSTDVLDKYAGKLRIGRAALHIGDHASDVGDRGGAFVRPGRRAEQHAYRLGSVTVVSGQRKDADNQRGEAEQGARNAHDDVERQPPYTQSIVQIRLLQPPRSAPAQGECVLEYARMRQQAGNERGEQGNTGQADQIQSPCARQVKLHVKLGDELRPRRRRPHHQPAVLVGQPLAFVAGFMVVVFDLQPLRDT